MFSSQPGKLGAVGRKTVVQRAIAVLRRFGQDAHIYLPGVGMLNGLTAANYLDSAGTTVGTVDQPVGLVLDAAGGLGVELVTNGDFSGGATGWAGFGAGGWAVTGNAATHTAGTYGLIQFNTPAATALKTYKVTFDCTLTAGDIKCYVGGVASTTFITGGAKEVFVSAGASPSYLIAFEPSTSFSGSIDNISVREVTGIAASQPTTASKPLLRRGAVAVSIKSGDLTAWQTTAAATITGGQADPFGGTAAQLMSGAGKNVYFTGPNSGSILAGETVTQLIHCYSAIAGTVLVGSPSSGATSLINVASGWGVYAFTWTSALNDGPSIILSGTLTAITVYRSALFRGTYTAQQIQALGGIPTTTTAPASTALGPQYWQFDGSNDSLALGGPLFQMADDYCVVAGFNRTGDSAAWQTLYSQAGNATRFQLSFELGKPNVFSSDGAGNTKQITGASVIPLGTSGVISYRKSASSIQLRSNGLDVATGTYSPSSAVLSLGAEIGSYNSGSDRWTGGIYPEIIVKGATTPSDLLLLEKFVGQLSGVQI